MFKELRPGAGNTGSSDSVLNLFSWVPSQNTQKITTSGPNPSQNNQKLPHLAQTQVLGPRTWVWARCGKFRLFWDLTQTRGSGPRTMGLGQMWSFLI